MFATIRRYTILGEPSAADTEATRRRIQDAFVPMIKDLPGFHGYYMLLSGGVLITMSLFETEQGIHASNRKAAEFVMQARLPVQVGPPEIVEGALGIALEPAVAH